jgi:hypothetical protein
MSEKEKEKTRKVDFRKIEINGVDNVIKSNDLSKLLGNMIFSQAKDVAEDEFARDVYNKGEVDITSERIGFIKKHFDNFNYALRTAIEEAISL